MSLREKSLNIEKNQRMFKFKLILMERILYNLILILILEWDILGNIKFKKVKGKNWD